MSNCRYCGHQNQSQASYCQNCGANLAASVNATIPALQAGTSLKGGEYIIGQSLGQGGFGITYVAQHNKLNRQVTIKELFPEGTVRQGNTLQIPHRMVATWRQAVQGFVNEAQMLAQFRHQGIVSVFDVFEEPALRTT
jgi:serine/threonine protein kinase